MANKIQEIHDNCINVKTREIYLIPNWAGEDGHDPGVDYRLSQNFLKNILYLDSINSKPIIIHQFSTGGDWDSAMAIFDAIKYVNSKTIFIMHGSAISCGTIIPQAADCVLISPNCTFMFHAGTTDINPALSHKQAQKWAEHEENLQQKMLEIYTNSCIKGVFFKDFSREKIKAYIAELFDKHEDCFLTPQKVVEYGLAHAILYNKTQLTKIYEGLEAECTQN